MHIQGINLLIYFKLNILINISIENFNATPRKIHATIIHNKEKIDSNLWKNLPNPIMRVSSNIANEFWLSASWGNIVNNKSSIKNIVAELIIIENIPVFLISFTFGDIKNNMISELKIPTLREPFKNTFLYPCPKIGVKFVKSILSYKATYINTKPVNNSEKIIPSCSKKTSNTSIYSKKNSYCQK